MKDLPDDLLDLADRQLGVIARWQLQRWLTLGTIDGHVRRGRLVRHERGIYGVYGAPSVPGQAAFAAVLRSRPSATVTGPAVLAHHRVDGFPADAPFEVLVTPGRTLRNVAFAWREDPRPDREVTLAGEVRLATAADAIVHAVRWREQLGDRALRLGVDWLGWRDVIDRVAFLDLLVARAPVDPNAAGLLEIIGGIELGRCESDGERVIGRAAACFDPMPQPQVWVTVARRADWYFQPLRLVIEYDGGVDHGAGASAADAERDAELAAEGIEVIRFTQPDLADVSALLARLATAVTVRALELGVPAPRFDPTVLAVA